MDQIDKILPMLSPNDIEGLLRTVLKIDIQNNKDLKVKGLNHEIMTMVREMTVGKSGDEIINSLTLNSWTKEEILVELEAMIENNTLVCFGGYYFLPLPTSMSSSSESEIDDLPIIPVLEDAPEVTITNPKIDNVPVDSDIDDSDIDDFSDIDDSDIDDSDYEKIDEDS